MALFLFLFSVVHCLSLLWVVLVCSVSFCFFYCIWFSVLACCVRVCVGLRCLMSLCVGCSVLFGFVLFRLVVCSWSGLFCMELCRVVWCRTVLFRLVLLLVHLHFAVCSGRNMFFRSQPMDSARGSRENATLRVELQENNHIEDGAPVKSVFSA